MATDFDDQERPARGGIGLAIAALAPVLSAGLVALYFRSSPPPQAQVPQGVAPATAPATALETQLADLRKEVAPALLALAREKLNAGDLDAARATAESAAAADLSLSEAQLTLGQVLACKKQFRNASGALNNYLDGFDGEARAARQLLELCQRGELAGDSPKLTVQLATVMGQMGMLAQAEAMLDDMERIPHLYGSHLRQVLRIRSTQTVARLVNGELHIDLRGLGTQAANVPDLLPLIGMRIHALQAPGMSGVRDLSVLRGMPLRELNLEGANVHDISPLEGMPLVKLSLTRCPFDSLHPIREAKLERLSIAGSQVSDLTPLRGMPLKWLEISSTKAWSLEPLAELPLEHLMMSSAPVADLAAIASRPIEHLDIRGTKVTDLRPLVKMPLRFLAVNDCKVDSLATLAVLPIEVLGINVTSPMDLSVLDSMPALRELLAGGPNGKMSLARFRELRKVVTDLREANPEMKSDIRFEHGADGRLQMASLERSGVHDIRALKALRMNQLRLFDSPVASLAPLQGMALRSLLLIRCPVADIEPLREMNSLRELSMVATQVSDLSPLAGKQLVTLSINDSPITDLSPLAGMKSLRQFAFSPGRVEKGLEAVRELRGIQFIGLRWENRIPAAQFWQRYDAGEFRQQGE